MSVPLSISNLTNIIAADYFNLGFGWFAGRMLLPGLFSLAASLVALLWLYRRDLPAAFDGARLPDPETAIRDPFLFRAGVGVLAAMGVTFALGHGLGIPTAGVVAGGAALLLAGARVNRAVPVGAVLRRAPWHVLVFSLGMYVVVFGLGKAGLTAWSAALLERLAAAGTGPALFGTGVWVAVLSAGMNNLPGMMSGALALGAAALPAGLREGMALAAVLGADIGPKLTPVGSLATLLWLHYLGSKGIRVGWLDYVRIGLVLTPPVLLAGLFGLWLSWELLTP